MVKQATGLELPLCVISLQGQCRQRRFLDSSKRDMRNAPCTGAQDPIAVNKIASAFPVDSLNPLRSSAAELYASEAQTSVLLRSGAEYRRQRINASDMISTDEAAELSGTTRVTINAWIKSGRCIGVTHLRRGFKMPKWQFEPYVFPVIRALSEALGTTDGWPMLSFLETPHEALDGLAPRVALERGAPGRRIVDLAIAEGH